MRIPNISVRIGEKRGKHSNQNDPKVNLNFICALHVLEEKKLKHHVFAQVRTLQSNSKSAA